MLSTATRRRVPQPAPPSSRGRSLKIAVLMGGVGHEREVSLVSGREVAATLAKEGHKVISWVLDSTDESPLDSLRVGFDVVFIALHGEWGEDGTVQSALAQRGVCYTGSGPEASARAFDKIRAKRLLARAGIPLANHRVVEVPFGERTVRHALRMKPPGPVVVKPARMGSSVGVVLCHDASQLRRALWDGARYGQPLLVEEFIPGRELTCGILGDRTLPIVEVVSARTFYDYKAKYESGSGTKYQVDPHDISDDVKTRIRRIALECHDVLRCDDFSRVDFRYDPDQDRLAVLEVNTIPGMTPTSLLPKAAAAAGISFGALLTRMCRMAMRIPA